MTDLLLAVLAATVLLVVGAGLFLLLVVAPFVVAVGRGERAGLSAVRTGAAQLGLIAVALLGAYVVRETPVLALGPLVLTWLLPVVLSGLRPKLLGAGGRHEP